MGLQTRADSRRESAASLMPLSPVVSLRRTRPKRTDPSAQLVPGQWAEIQIIGASSPLRGFVFSLRPSEILFTFPEVADFPIGLEPGRSVVVSYWGRTGRHTGHATVLRAAKGPPVTVAIQHPKHIEFEPRRRFPRVSLQAPSTMKAGQSEEETAPQSDERARIRDFGASGLLLETSLALAEGDAVNVTLPDSNRMAAQGARQVKGKVLRVEKIGVGRRRPHVASVQFSFDSDDERDVWARLVLAGTRKAR